MKKWQENNDYPANWESFIATGNKEAIGTVYFGHYDLLYNFGLKYTNDNQIIEDAIQNIFSYFLKTGGNLSPVKNLRGYLLQSFRHQLFLDLKKSNIVSHLKKNSQEKEDSHEPEVDEVYENEWSTLRIQRLDRCMEHLSKKQKEVLYLRFKCDLSYTEISDILGIAVDSCQKLVYRSLKALREDLEKIEDVRHCLILFFMNRL